MIFVDVCVCASVLVCSCSCVHSLVFGAFLPFFLLFFIVFVYGVSKFCFVNDGVSVSVSVYACACFRNYVFICVEFCSFDCDSVFLRSCVPVYVCAFLFGGYRVSVWFKACSKKNFF